MVINPTIKTTFRQYNISESEGLVCLLMLYYNIEMTPLLEQSLGETMKQINISKIVERDYAHGGSVKWNIPIHEGENIEWDWVITEYRKKFLSVNPDRAGSNTSCLKRMKDFFREHPSVRKEDVLKAVDIYMTTLSDPQYLTSADYFIIKDKRSGEVMSKLEQYVELVKARGAASSTSNVKMMG